MAITNERGPVNLPGLPVPISMRDQFAMHVLTGIAGSYKAWMAVIEPKEGGSPTDKVAEFCYKMADAMLSARTAQSPREAQSPGDTMRSHINEAFGK